MTSVISLQNCEVILKNVTNKRLKIIDFHLQPYSSEVVGFLAEHYKLIIKCQSEDRIVYYNFFVKVKPSLQQFKDYVDKLGVFRKEQLFYKNIVRRYSNNFAPKCFFLSEDLIVMEDLKQLKFSVEVNTLTPMQWNSVLKRLAEMHGLSIL